MASDPLIILLHWFSFDVDRGSGFHLFGDFILSFLPPSPRLLLPLLSTPTPRRLPPGASAVIQLPSRWWYSSLPECQMFLDRNKLHFFMAYGKLPWLLLLLYPLCELNMYSVACCLQCYCRVTYGTDSIRMKLALDNPSDYTNPDRLLLGLPSPVQVCIISYHLYHTGCWLGLGKGAGCGLLGKEASQTDRKNKRAGGEGI